MIFLVVYIISTVTLGFITFALLRIATLSWSKQKDQRIPTGCYSQIEYSLAVMTAGFTVFPVMNTFLSFLCILYTLHWLERNDLKIGDFFHDLLLSGES